MGHCKVTLGDLGTKLAMSLACCVAWASPLCSLGSLELLCY